MFMTMFDPFHLLKMDCATAETLSFPRMDIDGSMPLIAVTAAFAWFIAYWLLPSIVTVPVEESTTPSEARRAATAGSSFALIVYVPSLFWVIPIACMSESMAGALSALIVINPSWFDRTLSMNDWTAAVASSVSAYVVMSMRVDSTLLRRPSFVMKSCVSAALNPSCDAHDSQ